MRFCDLVGYSPEEIVVFCKENMDKFKMSRKSYQYVEYVDVLKENENFRIYKDKVVVVDSLGEHVLIEGFNYYKFYNDTDELIICLLVAYFTGLSFGFGDVSNALLDFYNQMKV